MRMPDLPYRTPQIHQPACSRLGRQDIALEHLARLAVALRREGLVAVLEPDGRPFPAVLVTNPASSALIMAGTGGRGLHMIDAMSDRWGFHANGDGRTTWFECSG
jgi:hypothetical protein